jgi:hypothetical protein
LEQPPELKASQLPLAERLLSSKSAFDFELACLWEEEVGVGDDAEEGEEGDCGGATEGVDFCTGGENAFCEVGAGVREGADVGDGIGFGNGEDDVGVVGAEEEDGVEDCWIRLEEEV